MYEHKNKLVEGFTKKYNLRKLVYLEATNDVNSAIAREKQLKSWHRDWKINLIKEHNPSWKDLSEEWDYYKHICHPICHAELVSVSTCSSAPIVY
jgi:putative endonuclease